MNAWKSGLISAALCFSVNAVVGAEQAKILVDGNLLTLPPSCIPQRALGAAVDKRNLGSTQDKRSLGSGDVKRMLGGDVAKLKCQLIPDQTGFVLLNVDRRATVGFQSEINGTALVVDGKWHVYTDNLLIKITD